MAAFYAVGSSILIVLIQFYVSELDNNFICLNETNEQVAN